MLSALHIQDFVLIEHLSLSLDKGLTALTGETGAGKSILLDAMGLACGGRADRGSVRQGAKQGMVTIAFEPRVDHPIWSLLEENGLDNQDDQVILRRLQSADGRGRGFVNDQPVSIAMLRTIGEALLEIHGQHDGRGFLTAAGHRDMLDDFGGHEKMVLALRDHWSALQEARNELDDKRQHRDKAIREADYLRHVVEELSTLAPLDHEETDLVEKRAYLMAIEKRFEDIRDAHQLMDDDKLESNLGRAIRLMEAASERGRDKPSILSPESTAKENNNLEENNPITEDNDIFVKAVAKLEAALSEVMEARAVVEQIAAHSTPDQAELSNIEERLFALRAAARKHGVTPETLPGFFQNAIATLDSLDAGESAFESLEETVRQKTAAYHDLAIRLSENRHKIGLILDQAVMGELKPLKLGHAQFKTRIITDENHPGREGYDQIEFMVSTNPGAPFGPLKTIASGGELSRFVLAMKAALATKERRTVIIFDEVDAGVGGAVADAVGERLARLARDTQVLVVTHSPQVAARAKSHWQVAKTQTDSNSATSVHVLSLEERREEIARMLSGATVTDEARAAAEKLLHYSQDATLKPRATKNAKKANTKTAKGKTVPSNVGKKKSKKTGKVSSKNKTAKSLNSKTSRKKAS